MRNRYRVELYDANKLNDLTIYSDVRVDKEYLSELAYSNVRKFSGTIRGYVYDMVAKKKTTALFLPEERVEELQSRVLIPTAIELGFV